MANSKKAAPTNEELFASLEAIGGEDDTATASPGTSRTGTMKPTPTSSEGAGDDDEDPADLAELKNLAAPRNSTSSRPSTPRIVAGGPARPRSPSALGRGTVTELYTPTTGSGRSSEEKAAAEAEAEAARSGSQSQGGDGGRTEAGGGGGGGGGSWWGGLSAFANAAVKQAQGAVQELQKNEEAQRWAEQMRGNVGALRGLGGQISSRALPTFTSILHTLAPPISQHERLQIHITHDLVNYPSLDPLIYQIFSRVMSQVEGGDLLVIQRGIESSHRRTDSLEGAYRGGIGSGSGWGDGPWWRQNEVKRSLGTMKGLVEGTKLVRVSAESYSNDFFAKRGGLEEAAKAATAILNESNPVRSSDIFLAIQAIQYPASKDLFAGSKSMRETENENGNGGATTKEGVEEEEDDEQVSFAIYLYDPIHSISFSSVSQGFPAQWAQWIDADTSEGGSGVGSGSGNGSGSESEKEKEKRVPQLPDEILEIIENDGVDPREWIAEWMEEVLGLAVGVVAQRYVARRMGVGEGGIGRGKRREAAVEANAGEAARGVM